MRGRVDQQENVWFMLSSEDLVPEKHPLREIKKLAAAELARLSSVFSKAYADSGRQSVPPERLSHSLHTLVDNRNGLIVAVEVAEASGTAERTAAKSMLKRVRRRHGLRPKTLAADKGYDDGQFLHEVEHDLNVKPHVPTRKGPIKATDHKGEARRRARRRKRTLGYQLSERKRRLVEKPFGWLKEIAGLRRTR